MTHVTVVIPTYNERETIQHTLYELMDAFVGSVLSPRIIVVDDSDDSTAALVAQFRVFHPSVSVIHRRPQDRTGLGTAILTGLLAADTEYVGVMDADGQHPPHAVVDMLELAVSQQADLVFGTRYRNVKGGTAGLDGVGRNFYSRVLRWIPQILLPPVRRVSDPLSGLFAVRKDAVRWDEVHPLGWKISLEVLIFSNAETVLEQPYVFQPRTAGESKANLSVGVTFFRHVLSLITRYYFQKSQ